MKPKHPIYIVSKGRSDSRLTSKALDEMGVDYRIAVEPQEYDDYAAVIEPRKILVLPFSNHGLGSYPARNWCWEHSISQGASWHWVMDDNISGFIRLNRNQKNVCKSPAIFKACEDFVERYENVAQAGLQYRFLGGGNRREMPPFRLNTRIFSCILIRNDVPFRFRLKYNEDVDLSLQMLSAGWCTVLFNAFMQNKAATLTVKGGNTEELYDNGSLKKEKAQMLVDTWPHMASLVERYGRWHHRVDFDVFKRNRLIKKNVVVREGVNNYGMKLVAQ
jgi:hypothetical protein